jgi:uncharacterized protein with FMN-binding domain
MVQQQSQKFLGMAIGAVVFLSLGYITVFGEKRKSETLIADQQAPATDSINNVQVPAQNNDQQTPTVTKRYEDEDEDDDDEGSNTPNQPLPPPVVIKKDPIPTSVATVYKDGTYSATGSYMSPGGYDEIGVTLTLSKDVITSVSATNGAGDGTSSRYIDKFISGFKSYVVGQNIADVHLTKVSGASLTPKGFNDAIAQIKTKAKV